MRSKSSPRGPPPPKLGPEPLDAVLLVRDDVVGVLEMHDVVRWMELPEPEPAIAPV